MPYDIDIEPHIIRVPSHVALPPGNVTAQEWMDLKGRVTGVENRNVDDFGGIDLSGGTSGDVLLMDSAGNVIAGTPDTNLWTNTGTTESEFGPVTVLSFRRGLTVNPHPDIGSYYAIVEPSYGAGPNQIPRGNHAHQLPSRFVVPITPGGYMSGGTRTLATRNVTLPAGKQCLVTATIDMQLRGGDPGPCYFRYHLTIAGNTRVSGAGTNGYWVVQGVPGGPAFSHSRTITGTGSAISVSASVSYYGGGGFYTDAGDLVIDVSYDR